MKIQFLGTGAADWPGVPAPQDAGDTSNRIRRWSSSLVDGHILIDPGPASYDFAQRLGVDCSKVDLILLTHSHSDHFSADALAQFAAAAGTPEFACHTRAHGRCKDIDRVTPLPLRLLEPMDVFTFGRYTITALPGNHLYNADGEICLHYLIDDGERRLYYGLDAGWFTADEWEFLMHKQVDCAVLDATCGDYSGDFRLGTHNSIPMLRIMEPSMRQNGILAEGGRIVLDHLARTLHKPNAEVEADMAREGYTVAFDGLTLEI